MINETGQADDTQPNQEVDLANQIGDLLNKGAETQLDADGFPTNEPLEDVGENANEDGDEQNETDDKPDETVNDDWKAKSYEVNGETISGAELASGYMKDADYRQKTAQTAQFKRETEQQMQYVQTELSRKADQLDVLAQALHAEIVGDQAQLAGLVESDPAEYLRRSHYLAQRNQLLQQAMQEREAVNGLQAQTSQRQMLEYAQAEHLKLIEALPEWKDKKVAEQDQREIAEYLLSEGYEAAELGELYDHRALKLARKAMLYDKRANLKPTPQKQSVSLTPGAPQSKNQTNTKVRESLVNRAVKSGSRDDFAAAISQYL